MIMLCYASARTVSRNLTKSTYGMTNLPFATGRLHLCDTSLALTGRHSQLYKVHIITHCVLSPTNPQQVAVHPEPSGARYDSKTGLDSSRVIELWRYMHPLVRFCTAEAVVCALTLMELSLRGELFSATHAAHCVSTWRRLIAINSLQRLDGFADIQSRHALVDRTRQYRALGVRIRTTQLTMQAANGEL